MFPDLYRVEERRFPRLSSPPLPLLTPVAAPLLRSDFLFFPLVCDAGILPTRYQRERHSVPTFSIGRPRFLPLPILHLVLLLRFDVR